MPDFGVLGVVEVCEGAADETEEADWTGASTEVEGCSTGTTGVVVASGAGATGVVLE